VPVTEVQPKAVLTIPRPGEELKVGAEYTVTAAAWAGERPVAKVEFSPDGGKTWTPMEGKGEAFKAAKWTAKFTPKAAGPLKFVARATDDKGNTQPDKRDADRRTYMINHLIPVELTAK
jgi:hypothetical protein